MDRDLDVDQSPLTLLRALLGHPSIQSGLASRELCATTTTRRVTPVPGGVWLDMRASPVEGVNSL